MVTIMRQFLFIYYFIILIISLTSNIYSRSNCYIRFENINTNSIDSLEYIINSYGGRVIHIFPPNEFICLMDYKLYNNMKNDFLIKGSHSDIRQQSVLANQSDRLGEFCWRILLNYDVDSIKSLDSNNIDLVKCGTNTSLFSDNLYTKTALFNPVSRSSMFNTEFLIGRTAVCVIIPESVGSVENWNIMEQDSAISLLVLAYDILSDMASDRNIDVSWIYEIHRSLQVNEEPIDYDRPNYGGLNWEFGWIDDAMSYLNCGDEWDAIFNNANRMSSSRSGSESAISG